jgi:hypothetical protein
VKNTKGKTVINCPALLDVLQNESDERCLASSSKWRNARAKRVKHVSLWRRLWAMLQMGCAANKLPVQYVTPAKWKGYFGLLSREKACLAAIAMQRFPDNASDLWQGQDDGRAEAALLCLYAAENMV